MSTKRAEISAAFVESFRLSHHYNLQIMQAIKASKDPKHWQHMQAEEHNFRLGIYKATQIFFGKKTTEKIFKEAHNEHLWWLKSGCEEMSATQH